MAAQVRTGFSRDEATQRSDAPSRCERSSRSAPRTAPAPGRNRPGTDVSGPGARAQGEARTAALGGREAGTTHATYATAARSHLCPDPLSARAEDRPPPPRPRGRSLLHRHRYVRASWGGRARARARATRTARRSWEREGRDPSVPNVDSSTQRKLAATRLGWGRREDRRGNSLAAPARGAGRRGRGGGGEGGGTACRPQRARARGRSRGGRTRTPAT